MHINRLFRLFVKLCFLFHVEVAFANSEVTLNHCVIDGRKEIKCVLNFDLDRKIIVDDLVVMRDGNGKTIEISQVMEVNNDFLIVEFYTNYICKDCKFYIIRQR